MPHRADDDWDDDELATEECPYCGAEIPENVPRCPYCERYISSEDALSQPKPVWIIVGAAACLIVALMWAMGH